MEVGVDHTQRGALRLGRRERGGPPSLDDHLGRFLQGELHRLCGESAQAEEAYHQASRSGRDPQPGLARLRLAQGQVDAAEAAIQELLSSLSVEIEGSREPEEEEETVS